MRKTGIVLFTTLLFALTIQGKLSKEEKGEILHYASQFLENRGSRYNLLSPDMEEVSDRLVFITNTYGDMFLLLARKPYDSLLHERVLAFTIGTRVYMAKKPDPFKQFIAYYDTSLRLMAQDSIPVESRLAIRRDSLRVVPLLRRIAWRQFLLNGLTPAKGEKLISGCGPVAMGQVMKYYHHPQRVTLHQEYTDSDGHALKIDLDSVPIPWETIKDYYAFRDRDSLTLEPLMKMCGVAVRANYSRKSTWANTGRIRQALMDHFGYSPGMHFGKKGRKEEELLREVHQEVENGRPVIMSGGNHIFVCDACMDEFFHLNLGWNGSANGWYRFITPINTIKDRTFITSALMGIQPAVEGENSTSE